MYFLYVHACILNEDFDIILSKLKQVITPKECTDNFLFKKIKSKFFLWDVEMTLHSKSTSAERPLRTRGKEAKGVCVRDRVCADSSIKLRLALTSLHTWSVSDRCQDNESASRLLIVTRRLSRDVGWSRSVFVGTFSFLISGQVWVGADKVNTCAGGRDLMRWLWVNSQEPPDTQSCVMCNLSSLLPSWKFHK